MLPVGGRAVVFNLGGLLMLALVFEFFFLAPLVLDLGVVKGRVFKGGVADQNM